MKPSEQKEYVAMSQELGVQHFIMAGFDQDDWKKQTETKSRHPQVSTCFGIHPWVAQTLSDDEISLAFKELSQQARQSDFVGELGLDGVSAHREQDWAKQLSCLRKSLHIAKEHDKPIIVHSVQAHPEVISELKSYGNQWRGIVHAFSGSRQAAEEFIKLGLLISVGPGILKMGFRKLKETVKALPANKIVIETDYPDPKDNTSNPELLGQVLYQLAQIRGENPGDLGHQLEKNSRQLLDD